MRQKLFQLAIGSLVFAPVPSFAAGCGGSSQAKGLRAVSGGHCSDTALSGKVEDIISTLFYVVGAIAVIILIMGGIRYITSTGDAKRVQAAKDTILYAVIGIIVAILARAIVGYTVGQIG